MNGVEPLRVRYRVLNVQLGDAHYEELIGQIRGDADLQAQMWADAEHRLEERPGKIWTVAAAAVDGRWIPAAWAAATVERHDDGPVLRCSDNYERRGVGREHGLYRIVHRARHATVVAPLRLPAVTYLFAQPIALHEATGWYRTGLAGTSREPGIAEHAWWELRRDADTRLDMVVSQAPV